MKKKWNCLKVGDCLLAFRRYVYDLTNSDIAFGCYGNLKCVLVIIFLESDSVWCWKQINEGKCALYNENVFQRVWMFLKHSAHIFIWHCNSVGCLLQMQEIPSFEWGNFRHPCFIDTKQVFKNVLKTFNTWNHVSLVYP